MIDLHDIERLQAKGALQETVFRSRLPVIGPLVAWLRAAWNSVSTKWYVRPLIQQQNEFNALVVNQLVDLTTRLQDAEALGDQMIARLQGYEALGEQVTVMAARLQGYEALATQVADVVARMKDHEAWLIAQDREHSETVHDLAELRLRLVQLGRSAQYTGAYVTNIETDQTETAPKERDL